MVGPNVNFYSASHPLDPEVRNGLEGPELGKEIHIGEDVWIAGNVTVLPGIKVGNGAVLGAGSVVTKDVAPYTIVAGNPARLVRRIECRAAAEYYGNLEPRDKDEAYGDAVQGPEEALTDLAETLESKGAA
jgi:acetyltransferase-like isoleucine patch superfamily enzyme